MSPSRSGEETDLPNGSTAENSAEREDTPVKEATSKRYARIDHGRRGLLKALPLAGAALVSSGLASARAHERVVGTAAPGNGSRVAFPGVLPLPDGFQPEGIVTGRGTEFFVGSLADGSVYRGDLRTGGGAVLVDPDPDRIAVGLSYDRRSDYLFVAGGGTGNAFVYDAETGSGIAVYQLYTGAGSTFVNDVVVTRTAAYFTDSSQAVLYRVPLGPGGQLPDGSAVEALPFRDDFEFVPGEFNANGIDAPPDGAYLIVVNSTTGLLYRIDPETGEASEIGLGEDTVSSGDGILLDGRTLYVVRNFRNEIAVLELDPGSTEGEIVGTITDDGFDIPTTVAEFGNALYAVNARFTTSPTAGTEYDVVRVSK